MGPRCGVEGGADVGARGREAAFGGVLEMLTHPRCAGGNAEGAARDEVVEEALSKEQAILERLEGSWKRRKGLLGGRGPAHTAEGGGAGGGRSDLNTIWGHGTRQGTARGA